MRLLGFGTSHSKRRNQVGWTRHEPVADFFALVQPDAIIHGKSPGEGADKVVEDEGEAHFAARGLDPKRHVTACPVDHRLDGPWPAAGHRRNERMFIETAPTVAACWVMGCVGSPMSSGSAGMARICRQGHGGRGPIPLVIFREDGIEVPSFKGPLNALPYVRQTLRGLYVAAPWARDSIRSAGEAVKAVMEKPQDWRREPQPIAHAWQALSVLRRAEPRLSPWVAVCEVVLGRVAG